METQIVVCADGTPEVRQIPEQGVPEKNSPVALIVAIVVLLGLLVAPFLVIPVAIWFLISYNINRGQ